MPDILITDCPDYPGNDLATGWMNSAFGHNIPQGTIIKGDPTGLTDQKYVHTRADYQVVCHSNPIRSPFYVRFIVDGKLTDWYKEESNNIFHFINSLDRDSNFKIREAKMEQKRTVVFNEEGLSFSVDGVEIKNGKYPEEINIEGPFRIEGDSLARLMVALGDNSICIEKEDLVKVSHRSCENVYKRKYSIYSNQKNAGIGMVNAIFKDRITELEEECVELKKETIRLRDKSGIIGQELYDLKKELETHNKLSPLKRMRKVKYTD